MKTLLRKKSFKIISISVLLLLAGGVFLKSQGANFSWSQNSWLGGISGNVAKHSTDADNTWTNYSAKDDSLNIKGDGDAELKKSDNWQETTDADFNAYTSKDSTLAVSGNSIKLLKANGATCSAAGDCQSNLCTGSICSAPFICGTSTISDIDGNAYATVAIGAQCWMRENLKTARYADGASITRGPVGATWNGADNGYYAYPPNTANTAEETLVNINANKLGFVYQWSAAMHGSTTPGVQGVCPNGWHLPTDAQYKTLEMQLGMTQAQADATGWRGTDQGTQMRTVSSTTFSGLLAGYRNSVGSFYYRASFTYFWSSSAYDASDAWHRNLRSGLATVLRFDINKAYGFSVRCLKN